MSGKDALFWGSNFWHVQKDIKYVCIPACNMYSLKWQDERYNMLLHTIIWACVFYQPQRPVIKKALDMGPGPLRRTSWGRRLSRGCHWPPCPVSTISMGTQWTSSRVACFNSCDDLRSSLYLYSVFEAALKEEVHRTPILRVWHTPPPYSGWQAVRGKCSFGQISDPADVRDVLLKPTASEFGDKDVDTLKLPKYAHVSFSFEVGYTS